MDITTALQAETLVIEHVLNQSPHHFVVVREATQERSFGWVVSYTTQAYLRSHNPRDVVPGTGPVVVTRKGRIIPLTSSLPPGVAIEEFERNWKPSEDR